VGTAVSAYLSAYPTFFVADLKLMTKPGGMSGN